MARGHQTSFGLGGAGRARKRADRRGQPDKVEPLALECLGSMGQPLADRAGRAALKCDFDEAGVTAVEAAQEMHGIGQIAAGMAAGAVEQCGEMRMARKPLARDTSELGRGNADRLLFD